MRVLVLGGGGREHALCWAIRKSPDCEALFCAPGNAGIASLAECVALDPNDGAAVLDFVRAHRIDLTVIGPEAPLAAGVSDALRAAGALVFGPSRAAAMLEASKRFTKEVAAAANAPTAGYAAFTDAVAAEAYLRDVHAPRYGVPVVVKADGLAAGKGVVIAETIDAAVAAMRDMLGGAFGGAGAEVVIEEFMQGEEASLFVLTDGETAIPLGGAQDHKRAYDGDKGPNTGGMGAYSPAPILDDAMTKAAMTQIVRPVLAEMKRRGAPYSGVLYAGLMIEDGAPRLVEFNARFGDPECQVVLPRLKSDLLAALHACAKGELAGVALDWRDEACLTVVIAADGYPGAYVKGEAIRGLEAAAQTGALVFHAGTSADGERVLSNGGRVLNVTAMGADVESAQAAAYAACDRIIWPGGFYRRDIGWRATGRS